MSGQLLLFDKLHLPFGDASIPEDTSEAYLEVYTCTFQIGKEFSVSVPEKRWILLVFFKILKESPK